MNQFSKVVVFSGHMIDRPERKNPRFPASQQGIVRQQITSQLQTWRIGATDLAICGGACGGDILFAEACTHLGATVRLYIPLPEAEFITRSVRLENTNWEERYQKLSNHPHVSKYYQQDARLKIAEEISVFERNNLWIIDSASQLAPSGNLFALLVWDEKPTGDGSGGTSDFAHKIEKIGGHIAIINPTKL